MALYYIRCAMAKSKAEFGSIKKDIDGQFVRYLLPSQETTLQKLGMCDEINCPEKRFKILSFYI